MFEGWKAKATMFEGLKAKKDLRRREQLTPEWRFWEDVLNARNQLSLQRWRSRRR